VKATAQTSPTAPKNARLASAQLDKPIPGAVIDGRPGSKRQQERTVSEPARQRTRRKALWITIITCAALVIVGTTVPLVKRHTTPTYNSTQQARYLGLYERDMPSSYAGVTAFTTATGVQPNVLMYYSSWLEPFQAGFAAAAAQHGAIPLVQINPYNAPLTTIAAGGYDGYLRDYASAVRSYQHPVILSFGHEMNGNWYPWSYTHASASDFVAAWRHIVTVFRQLQVQNVIWLWTVNIIDTSGGIPSPARWWPGDSYVTWVGVDGYYYQPSWTFTSLFGPTIVAVRALTSDPILIAETGAAPAQQPTKITDLFAGVRAYGLLGFVWFNEKTDQDWRLTGPAAIAAFHEGAKTYHGLRLWVQRRDRIPR
jgi:hypothetical protein